MSAYAERVRLAIRAYQDAALAFTEQIADASQRQEIIPMVPMSGEMPTPRSHLHVVSSDGDRDKQGDKES